MVRRRHFLYRALANQKKKKKGFRGLEAGFLSARQRGSALRQSAHVVPTGHDALWCLDVGLLVASAGFRSPDSLAPPTV
jgi:hypothetical protein